MTQIIPRSSSVIVERLPSPAARPGKGKASMYLASTPQFLPSEPVLRGSSINGGTTYHEGAMSKQFDGKDEQTSLKLPKVPHQLLMRKERLPLGCPDPMTLRPTTIICIMYTSTTF